MRKFTTYLYNIALVYKLTRVKREKNENCDGINLIRRNGEVRVTIRARIYIYTL